MHKVCSIAAAALLFAFGFTATAHAQVGFGAHAGISIPVSDYGSSEETGDAGFAELGFTGGLDLWVPLGSVARGLSWYSSVEATAHNIDEDELGGSAEGGYLLLPLMTGLRFDLPIGPASAFVTGQAGVVFVRGPEATFDGPELIEGDWSTDFGFNVGAGAQITDNIYAGVKYYPLGDVELQYESGGTEIRPEIPISYVDIYVGFGVR